MHNVTCIPALCRRCGNLRTDTPTRIPARPAGAVDVYEWEPPARTGHPQASRAFAGTERIVNGQYTGDIMVRIEGTQHADGRVERRVLVDKTSADCPLTAAEARRLGCAIIAAADEVERQTDISEVITYQDACAAGVAVVCADADKFGATL